MFESLRKRLLKMRKFTTKRLIFACFKILKFWASIAVCNAFHIPHIFKLHFLLLHFLLQSTDISLILSIQHTMWIVLFPCFMRVAWFLETTPSRQSLFMCFFFNTSTGACIREGAFMRMKTVNCRPLITLHEQERSKHLKVFNVYVCHFSASVVGIEFVDHLQSLSKKFPPVANDLLYSFLQEVKSPTNFDQRWFPAANMPNIPEQNFP